MERVGENDWNFFSTNADGDYVAMVRLPRHEIERYWYHETPDAAEVVARRRLEETGEVAWAVICKSAERELVPLYDLIWVNGAVERREPSIAPQLPPRPLFVEEEETTADAPIIEVGSVQFFNCRIGDTPIKNTPEP